jgi:hypothetical protein
LSIGDLVEIAKNAATVSIAHSTVKALGGALAAVNFFD